MLNRPSDSPGTDPSPKLVEVVDATPSDASKFDYWRAVGSPLFDVLPRAPVRQFRFESKFARIDGLIFGQQAFSASRYVRSDRLARTGETDVVNLHLPLIGQERGVHAGDEVLLSPDRVTLSDWAHPFETSADDTEKLGVIVPRELLDDMDWIHEGAPTLEWPLASNPGRAVARHWLETWRRLPGTTEQEASEAAANLIELINGLVYDLRTGRVQKTPRCSGESELSSMIRFIEENLHRPAFGPDDVANAFRCSRATLYRHFSVPGGVKGYIQDLRLAGCHRDLSSKWVPSHRVYKISQRWGFHNQPYFHRIFKERYGKSPLEVVRDTEIERMILKEKHFEESRTIQQLHQWLV